MEPIKIFLNLKQWLQAAESSAAEGSGDPLRHPNIIMMKERELADLPFPGFYHPATESGEPLPEPR